MKKLFYPLLAGVLLISSAFVAVSNSQEWKIEDGFSIKFTSKDPTGVFTKFSGTINFDEADLANSKFDVTIDVTSIDMKNKMKNEKAKTHEWFDAAKFPTITYTSSKVERLEAGGYQLTGDLKMKGIIKTYVIPVQFTDNKFTGTFNVKRSDFGVGKTSDVVPDVMKIDFSVPVSKK